MATYIAQTLLEPGNALGLVEDIERELLSLDHMPYRFPERHRGVYANRGYRQMLVNSGFCSQTSSDSARLQYSSIRWTKAESCSSSSTSG